MINMLTETVNLDWVANRQFIMQDHNGFPIIMDQPHGVSASDLLPLSLIGCSSYDVVAILEKQRLKVTDLSVSAESTRDPDPPYTYLKIHVHYKVSGWDLDPARVAKAIQLSEEKYCGVFATLKKAVEITSDFEIIETKETA
jgi:putative redox protein